ncbi:GntR family transcriptional regulator [Roseomonas sp. M0104]|uniref:GntR family transcriptional regulator n=1 Tax=Teichococcus coralli TaxID=2545983 RepID=A0A845BG63_9PROT|nr:amidohydrolase family protein [Pseudoroseomonas coralli]MXP66071.1 GntR family transcriptional regulator [Pseudoroseomonas coralli]
MTEPSVGPCDAKALCPGPDPEPHGPTRFTVPAGAVDTHAHVIGLPPDWPLVPNRSYTPPAAPREAYLAMLDATGMTYGVLVQVSVHGTDNRLMLQTLRADPQRLRGVAVAALGRPDSEYRALKEAGVTGLRVNVLFGGGVSMDDLESYGDLCREYGWHLQFLLDARDLPQLAPRLARLPVPAVVDHMGHFPAAEGVGHPGFQALLGLVRDGAWVKLSGAYRLSNAAPAYAEATPLARALLEAAPGRCVWGSDWPHVANWGAMPNVGDLLDLLADWAPDEAVRHRILVENPARLYGFPAVKGG